MDHYKERAGDGVDFTIQWKPFRSVILSVSMVLACCIVNAMPK